MQWRHELLCIVMHIFLNITHLVIITGRDLMKSGPCVILTWGGGAF